MRALAVFFGVLLTFSGCSLFVTQTEKSEPSSLPPVQPETDTVGLEVAFITLPAHGEAQIAPMWSEVDETHLSTDLRRQLVANGIRCGQFGSQMPAHLRQMVDEVAFTTADSDQGVKVGAGPVHICRHMQSRTGQRSELLASDVRPKMTVLLSGDEGQVLGNTYHDAQCVWALKTFPQGDGRVRVQLTPEIHYGQLHNRWVGQGTGIFRQVSGRRQKSFDGMRIDTHLAPGQTLVLAGTDRIRGLGQHFFNLGTPTEATGTKLLLVRLARTQYDDLFSSGPNLAPIVPATP